MSFWSSLLSTVAGTVFGSIFDDSSDSQALEQANATLLHDIAKANEARKVEFLDPLLQKAKDLSEEMIDPAIAGREAAGQAGADSAQQISIAQENADRRRTRFGTRDPSSTGQQAIDTISATQGATGTAFNINTARSGAITDARAENRATLGLASNITQGIRAGGEGAAFKSGALQAGITNREVTATGNIATAVGSLDYDDLINNIIT